MTKREQIVQLYKESKRPDEIVRMTGASPKYVYNVISDVKNPGTLSAAAKKYRERSDVAAVRKQYMHSWVENNPKKRAHARKSMLAAHQAATRANADQHCKRWTAANLDYLIENANDKTIRQIALHLQRTYAAVCTAANKHGISLKGDKMRKGARFKGMYAEPKDPQAGTPS